MYSLRTPRTGCPAPVAAAEIDRDGRHVFTDYISLYKVGGDWKIIAKIFHRHP